MKRFGDMPPETITTRDVSAFLRELNGAGIAPKTVNKYRELLHAIFNYARRSDTYGESVFCNRFGRRLDGSALRRRYSAPQPPSSFARSA